MLHPYISIILCSSFLLSACGDNSQQANENIPDNEDIEYTVLTERFLDADGIDSGLSAYEIIRHFAGEEAIEAPDLYEENHPGEPHIYEDTDDEVGDHFVFTLHRDEDIDRDRVELTDRQRNEIKAYSDSEKALKAYEGETFKYQWKFKLNDLFEVSSNFTHVFQLKSVDDGIGTPLLAFTGRERDGIDVIEIGHVPVDDSNILDSHVLSDLRGEWITVTCQLTFSEKGEISVTANRLRDNLSIFDVNVSNVDTWRGTESDHFVRPKWGILRSLDDADNLREDEETVRFANFIVTELIAE